MLTDYEENALHEIRQRKDRMVAKSPRKVVPAKAKDARRSLADRAQRVPGMSRAAEKAAAGYSTAAQGLGKLMTESGNATLSPDRIVASYQKRGLPVSSLGDIRALALEEVERRAMPRRMDLLYASAAAAEGAAAGAVISGGEALALLGSVAGAGAGGAPGIGAVATAMAGDAAFVLAAASRAVGHTAMYYGYDPNDPAEAVYMLSVVNLGSAMTAGGKVAAYQELSKLAQMLARRATWKQLNEHVIPRLAQAFALRFGGRLTQRKLGQLVPVVGVAVGAGLNYKLLDDVMEAARWTYRERFILDKGSAGGSYVPERPPTEDGPGEDEVPIRVLELLENEGMEMDRPG